MTTQPQFDHFMAEPIGRSAETDREARNHEGLLKYAFDAGFLSGTHPSDTHDADSATPRSSESESSESDGLADLAASFRVFSESILRMEVAELEMIKSREASRLEAEKRRAELETELTQMLLQTQLQIASYISGTSPSRKRKRSDHEDNNSSTSSQREGTNKLMSLLQCNLV